MVINQDHFTIEQFYKFLSEGKLIAGKCKHCGKTHLPPRPMCKNCLNQEFSWTEIPKEGKLLTYTTIHIAPQKFQNQAPYSVGIVEFKEKTRLPGIIKNIPEDKLKIGMNLKIDCETKETSDSWPQWPRYYFKKLK